MSDVMTGVPSIVMGLFVYTIFTLRFGLIGFGGSLALACLMLPIVIRSTEEMLKLVPDELRQAQLRPRQPQVAHHRHRGAARRLRRHHLGRDARHRPRRRRDRPAAVHHRCGARKLNTDLFDGP